MNRWLLFLSIAAAAAHADTYTTTWVCRQANGTKAAQDHPCATTQGDVGTIATHQDTWTDRLQSQNRLNRETARDPGCSIYATDWKTSNSYMRDSTNNATGAMWSERMRRDEAYLQEHHCN